MRALRAQLEALRGRAGQDALAASIAAADDKAAALESGAGENLTRLGGDLGTMLGILEGTDAAPTTQAVAAVGELDRTLVKLLARWSELRARDLTTLNARLREANLPPVAPRR